jgi:hypothetical protein
LARLARTRRYQRGSQAGGVGPLRRATSFAAEGTRKARNTQGKDAVGAGTGRGSIRTSSRPRSGRGSPRGWRRATVSEPPDLRRTEPHPGTQSRTG